ncbi:hypothetical protein NOW40_002017 [Vibrio parahaemolyticus]|nr:hypothetical protein [Vibrio parahaemolyticus]
MENIVVLMFLIVFGWLAISNLFFFFLFFMVWSALKLQKHELIQGRYAVLRLPTFLHGLWISMSCFMEEKAFLKLQAGWLKSSLKWIYPVYVLWDRTFIFVVVVFLLLAGWLCFA